ncbi:MAG: DUF2911 domain-containing protein [Thermoanaerobaculia bacterium]|nr:DUF2911 domain-containing protein [Thermoanaerobaculia bacterium]
MRNLIVASAFLIASTTLAEIKLPRVSPRATISQEIGIAKVVVAYHRPAVKGRMVWGDLVPLGKVWRLGANDATTIEISHDSKINGVSVPAGKYALFAIPNKDEWEMILNKEHQQWGAFFYKMNQDQARFTAKPLKSDFAEWLDINLLPLSDRSLRADIRWEKVRVPFTIEFDMPALVWKHVNDEVAVAKAEDWQTWHNAARHAMNSGERLEEGLAWVDKAMAAKEHFWNYELKALVLHKLGRTAEAYPLMEKAKAAAQGKAPKEYIEGLDRTLASWKK